jgi:hypothetical protein
LTSAEAADNHFVPVGSMVRKNMKCKNCNALMLENNSSCGNVCIFSRDKLPTCKQKRFSEKTAYLHKSNDQHLVLKAFAYLHMFIYAGTYVCTCR